MVNGGGEEGQWGSAQGRHPGLVDGGAGLVAVGGEAVQHAVELAAGHRVVVERGPELAALEHQPGDGMVQGKVMRRRPAFY